MAHLIQDSAIYKENNLDHYLADVRVFEDDEEFELVSSEPDTKVENAAEDTNKVEEMLTEEQLLIATPLLFGFSLSDKLWCKSYHFHRREW